MIKKILVLFTCFILFSISLRLEAKNKDIKHLYQKGESFLQNNQPEKALKIFEQIVDENYYRPEGHYGLGLTLQMLYPDSNLAIAHYKQAIKLSDDFRAPSWYQTGLLYKNLKQYPEALDAIEYSLLYDPLNKEGWYVLDTLSHLAVEPLPEKIMNKLPELLRLNPANDTLGTLYLRASLWHDNVNDAIDELNKIYDKGFTHVWLILALAELHLRHDEFQEGLALLDSHRVQLQERVPFEQNLLQAKLNFQLLRDSLGLSHYWQAVKTMSTEKDVQKMYNDLYPIFTQEEYHELKNLTIDRFEDFYQRFWLSRDPDHSTRINERIPEHYRRFATALKDFRRYAGNSFNNEIFYRFNNPGRLFGLQIGDDYIKSLNPGILPKLRPIDDLGIIYIRHGKWDNRVFYLCMDCAQNLSIEYYRKPNRPKLIFHFIKYGGWRNWMLETFPTYLEGRSELDNKYLFFKEDPLFYGPKINKENKEYAHTGYTTETTGFEFPEDPLFVPFTFLNFNGENGETLVDFFYGLNGRDIRINDNILSLHKFLALYDSSWREVKKIDRETKEMIPISYKDSWQSGTIVDKNSFFLPPGRYYYEFQITDHAANKRCLYWDTVEVVSYNQNYLMMSDVLLSDLIEASDRTAQFRKGNLVYRPHMFTHYTPGSVLGIYFEIYNLFLNSDDRSDFQLTWKFNQTKKSGNFFTRIFKRQSPGLTSSVTYNGEERDDHIYFNIDLSGQPEGKYQLNIDIKDNLSGNIAADSVEIFITPD